VFPLEGEARMTQIYEQPAEQVRVTSSAFPTAAGPSSNIFERRRPITL
jgi:hypothetical protein